MRRPIVLVRLPALVHSVLIVPLEGGSLGRSTKCDLVLDHTSVSRRHAFLAVNEAGLLVTDLASKNGTFVDDVPVVGTAAAALGSPIRFGSLDFHIARYESGEDEPDSFLDTNEARSPSGQLPVGTVESRRLSVAQRRVFSLLLEGLSEKRIASRLKISLHTVHNHTTAIYRAFRVHSRSEFLVLALAGKAAT